MSEKYHEKQYLGFNRYGISRRLTLAGFCFVFYGVAGKASETDASENVFFFLGIAILVLCLAALWIRHLEIKVNDGMMHLNCPMTRKKIQIPLAGISRVRIRRYSRYKFNRTLFNNHRRGKIRFYTHGKMAVQFTANGSVFLIGSTKAEKLFQALLPENEKCQEGIQKSQGRKIT